MSVTTSSATTLRERVLRPSSRPSKIGCTSIAVTERLRTSAAQSGIQAPDGKGLGIVAGDFDGTGRLSLFVANDTTANFLFLNRTASRSEAPSFVEQGIISGCALDLGGKAQASMGVAADDADGDGLIDLFVTNFYNEYNTLYRQLPGGVFADVSNTARLKEPSLAKLGFGTQFIDADLDGWPDLVVANGHVDDFRSHGIPYRMQAQFLRTWEPVGSLNCRRSNSAATSNRNCSAEDWLEWIGIATDVRTSWSRTSIRQLVWSQIKRRRPVTFWRFNCVGSSRIAMRLVPL